MLLVKPCTLRPPVLAQLRAESWHAPGLLLLGDAAHPMSPIRAQGINLAFRDVIVAANHLVPVLKSQGGHVAVDEVLVSIQAEREPEVSRSQVLQQRDTQGIGTWCAPLLIGLAGFLGPARDEIESRRTLNLVRHLTNVRT
jgi:2-polyprenyl-6-methoxyphenol hydroxylase-like FAD-dependent oxidoreductase